MPIFYNRLYGFVGKKVRIGYSNFEEKVRLEARVELPDTIFCRFYRILVFCAIVFCVSFKVQASENPPIAKNGFLDLSNFDFKSTETVSLSGEWDFYWKSFLDSIGHHPDKVQAPVPGIWNDLPIEGIEPFGYGTYKLTLVLPKNRPPLAFEIPDKYSAYEFYVNGSLFSVNGKVAKTKEGYIPKFIPTTRALNVSKDTLVLEMKIANFDHSKGGFGQTLILGNAVFLFNKRVLHFSLDIFLVGSLTMGGLFFLGLYLFGNQSRPILYFAFFCIAWGYRIVGSGIYALHSLFSNIPWIITLKLEYISMFLAAFFFTRYTYFLHPKEMNVNLERLFMLAFGALIVVTLLFPPYIFTQLVIVFFIIVFPGFVVVMITHTKSILNQRTASIYSIISSLIIFFVFIYFFLSYFGLFGRVIYVTFLGSLAFVFFQSLVLSFRYSRELKDAKEAAEQAATAKTEFLSTMSHEIRTPLNAVIGLSNFLIEENPRNDQKDSLDNLKFASENLLSLINDILDYNKIDAGKIDFEEKPFDIRRLLESTIAAYKYSAEEKGVSLSYKANEHIPEIIVGDITRLSQVLTNLIGNAIKFTKKGFIEVRLNIVARVNEKVAIKFSVQDTGVGIPPEKQKLIFESFTQASSSTTREFGGSGLGLAITDKLLGLMGSKLFLKSKLEEGSTFYFTHFFEVSEVKKSKSKVVKENEEFSLEGCAVLIVEDTQVNVLVARKFLEKWGMVIESAENGAVALEHLKKQKYDIILMDLQMPVMDGYQATEAIRQMGDNTPIIALTAAAVTEIIEKIELVGMNAYVTKPFNPVVLQDKITELLQKHQKTKN